MPFIDFSLHFHCLSLTVHCLSLTFRCLFATQHLSFPQVFRKYDADDSGEISAYELCKKI